MTHRRHAAAVVASGLLFGTTGTAALLADTDASALSIAAGRLLVGAAGLVVFASFAGWYELGALLRMARVWVMGIGVATYMLLFFASVQQVGAAMASLVSICLAPVFTAVGARVVGKPWPNRLWLIGTVLAVIGVTLLAWPDPQVSGGRWVGAALAAGASAAYAAYTVTGSGLAEHGVPPRRSLAVSFGIGAVLCSPFLMADSRWLLTGRGVALVLWLGLAATTLAYALFGYGLSRLKPGVVATLTLSEPAMATVLGIGVLGEVMTARGWIGCTMIVVALLVTARSK